MGRQKVAGGVDRRFKLTDERRNRIIQLAALGHTDREIVKKAGITLATLYRWFQNEPILHETVKMEKARALAEQVHPQFIKLAKGYQYTETTIKTLPNGTQEITKHQRHAPPNFKALQTLISRWDPTYRDRHEVAGKIEHEHTHGLDPELQELIHGITQEPDGGED
jgi:AcrR family transcriptional regulator